MGAFHNSKLLRWILLKLLDSDYYYVILLFPTFNQNLSCTLGYNSKNNRWIFVSLSEKEHYYIVYRFSMFYQICNFLYFHLWTALYLHFLLHFLLQYEFSAIHGAHTFRTHLYTHALLYARTIMHTHTHPRILADLLRSFNSV